MYDMFDMDSDMRTPITESEKVELASLFNDVVINGTISKQSYYSLCSSLRDAKNNGLKGING